MREHSATLTRDAELESEKKTAGPWDRLQVSTLRRNYFWQRATSRVERGVPLSVTSLLVTP